VSKLSIDERIGFDSYQVGLDDRDSEEYMAMRGREQQLYTDYRMRGLNLGNINNQSVESEM